MTSHDTFLQLAAIAVDYPLSSGDRGRLEAHLASCPACARSAHGFRADAIAFGNLPAITLPERRGAEILAAAMHPAAIRHPLRLVLVAALLALLALGSLVAGAELLRRSQDDLSMVLPVPSPSPTPRPDDTNAPAPSVDPNLLPDGLIAYVGVESGERVIRTVHPDGTDDAHDREGRGARMVPGRDHARVPVPVRIHPRRTARLGHLCDKRRRLWATGGRHRRHEAIVVTRRYAPPVRPFRHRCRRHVGRQPRWVRGTDVGRRYRVLVAERRVDPAAGCVGRRVGRDDRPPGRDRCPAAGTCRDAAWSLDGTQLACTVLRGAEGELRAIRVTDGSIAIGVQRARPARQTDMVVRPTHGHDDERNREPRVEAGDHLYLVDFQTRRDAAASWTRLRR